MDYTHLLAIDIATVTRGKWWCGHCGGWRTDEKSMVSHLKAYCSAHEDEFPEHQVDYFDSDEFVNLIRNTKSRAIQAADRFADHLDSCMGVEDFMFECRGWE